MVVVVRGVQYVRSLAKHHVIHWTKIKPQGISTCVEADGKERILDHNLLARHHIHWTKIKQQVLLQHHLHKESSE